MRALGAGRFELVVPSISMLAEPPVAVVDRIAQRRGTTELARAYLEFLYSPQAQEIVARHHFRPRDAAVLARHAASFPPVQMVTIADLGGWEQMHAQHFAEGGVFDRIQAARRATRRAAGRSANGAP